MKILGIETSCDETAVAVVEDGVNILSNLVASQIDIHARYGGIVPEVASRQHLLTIIPLFQQAMAEAKLPLKEIDGVAVTHGPGLAGSLLVGLNFAKAIAWARGLPLIGVNHLEAHIYSNWLVPHREMLYFPLVCLLVSGGHTDLLLMRGHDDYKLLGQTRDDASGEAFDKAARLLGLGFPGGPALEKAAAGGNPAAHKLPRAWLKGSADFSFSGLKTALLHLVERGQVSSIADAAASFQQAVVEVLVMKTLETARRQGARVILLAGGVAANSLLRRQFLELSPLPVFVPPPSLCTDNAAMTAACGYFRLRAGKVDGWGLDALPGLRLG